MTRYQALRGFGCSWLTAVTVAIINKLKGVPDGLIIFVNIEIEYTP